MDQLAAMRAFARVVETGTFTHAARSLRTPKPTVTKLIQSLEAHVQTKLLNRTTRRVTVTPDGAAYYERVTRLLADLDDLDTSMTLSQAHPKGKLRIDVSPSLALLVIIPALPDFHARYPDIQIEVGVTDRPVDLIAENVDCVVRAGNPIDESLVARRIGELDFVTCATPAYLDRHGVPRDPADLERNHHTVNYFNHSGQILPLNFQRGGERSEVNPRHIVAVNDGNAYVAAALAGLGIIQVPTFMVRDHLASGAFRPILSEWETSPKPLYIVFPPNKHLSNKVRVFVDWIIDLFTHAQLNQRGRAAAA